MDVLDVKHVTHGLRMNWSRSVHIEFVAHSHYSIEAEYYTYVNHGCALLTLFCLIHDTKRTTVDVKVLVGNNLQFDACECESNIC